MVRISPHVTRSAPPTLRWASLLAVALLVLAAGPAAATVADALVNRCCSESCPPPEAPTEGPTCCAQAPAAGHDVAVLDDLSGERIELGSIEAEHVFTRPFADAAGRRVAALPDGCGLPSVPERRSPWRVPARRTAG